MNLFITPLAETDLDQILAYIAESRPLTAVAVIRNIREKCQLIATQPEMGQLRPEFQGNYRSFPVQRWVIFYRIRNDTVEIHRIVDGARDVDSLFG